MANRDFEQWIQQKVDAWWDRLSPASRGTLGAAVDDDNLSPEVVSLLIESQCPIGPVATKWEGQEDYSWSWSDRIQDFVTSQTKPAKSAYETHGLEVI
ncbi:hypothetical protein [Branchiibius sp. NY16-3462-2]|uniref:hypothetical protein n=1 Tax=Branchiibius sp. NY16-3462-2 TaxID=1807500 RepID=UPI0007967D8B|nr:hypothetical protein [Branchiibius sp. NY16-3462-2]KYH43677.1 hypothetical protein AZH51_02380 [Branchiibius sp. NY16-3462-2]